MEQRQHTRFKVESPVSFTGDHDGTGTVYNLGLGGCKVIASTVVANGSILAVQLHIPTEASTITIHAVAVRWTMEGEFGLDFLGMKESERDRLAQFLNTLAKASPR